MSVCGASAQYSSCGLWFVDGKFDTISKLWRSRGPYLRPSRGSGQGITKQWTNGRVRETCFSIITTPADFASVL